MYHHVYISEVVYIPRRNLIYYVGKDQENVTPRIIYIVRYNQEHVHHVYISEVVYIPRRNLTYYVGKDQENVRPRIIYIVRYNQEHVPACSPITIDF